MRWLAPTLLVAVIGASCRAESGRLARAGGPAEGDDASAAETSPTFRRVWAGPDVDFSGSPTPDGRLLTYADWGTGNLAIRDAATGQAGPVTSKGTWDDSGEFTLSSAVSPDGREIAYAWFSEGFELRTIGVDGSRERTLYRNDQVVSYLEPVAWSPDGKAVMVVTTRTDGSNQIVLVPVAGGAARVLRSFDWRWPGKPSFSPDGRFIAYSFPITEGSPARDLYLFTLDGGQERNLTSSAADEHLLGWLPDGSGLLYVARNGAMEGFWRLPLRNGRPAGEPVLVGADAWRVTGIGASKNGYFYGVTVDQRQVYTASIDVENARLLTDPAAVSDPAAGQASAPGWSPDGAHLAYVLRPAAGGAQLITLVIHSTESGEARELKPDLQTVNGIHWAPDGRTLFVNGIRKGRRGIYQVDLQTGEVRAIAHANPRGGYFWPPHVSPDGSTLFYIRQDLDTTGQGIFAQDLQTGAEREIYRGRFYALTLSPDGRHLAFVPEVAGDPPDQLMVLSVDGGEPRVLHQLQRPEIFSALGGTAWTPDGRHILFIKARYEVGGRDDPADVELHAIPAAGGESRPILTMKDIRSIRVHPDGRRVAYSAGEFRGEVWVIENLAGGMAPRSEAPE